MFHFRSSTSSVIRCGVGKFGGWAAAGGGGERQLASRKTNHNFSSLAMSRMMVASGSHGSLTIRKRPIYNSKIQYAHPKKADYLAPSAHLLLGGQHLQTGQHLSLLQNQLGAVSHFSSQIPPPRRGGNRVAQGAGLLGAASLLFGKTKYVLAALKLTKLASLGSMIVSIGAYSMFFGLPYACGIVGLITVHEAGHAYVMHMRGIPFTPMVFLPFMGAVIATKEMPRDAWEDALIAAGGPVAGSLGAGAVAVAAHMTESQLLYALADFGFMINLFNLLPIGSMDGGRWAGALSKYVGVAGVGLGGVIAYNGLVGNPLFYLIWLAGTYETFQKFYNPHFTPPNYYKITNTQRAALTGSYFGLVVALLIAMDANQRHRKSPEQLIHDRKLHEPMWDDSTSHF